MKKALKTVTALFFSTAVATAGFAAPANATVNFEQEGAGTPWSYVDYGGNPSMEDLQVASAQYQARDGYSLPGALGMNTYEVLNLEVPAAGLPTDLGNGTCPGPMRYTDVTDTVEYVAELGECGGWERYGWLEEGNVVRLSGEVSGNYMVNDVLALGAPGNENLHYTNTPDVVLMVNNANASNQMYLFGLIDYTQRVSNVPVA